MKEQHLQGIIKRDEQAIRQMVQKYQDYVYTIALRIVKQKESAEEITQDVFLKVVAKIDTFNRRSKFSTWLFTIAYRTALNATGNRNIETALEEESILDDSYVDFDSGDCTQEQQHILWAGIDKLSTNQGVVISLFYLQQFSISEIAGIMNIPQNSVKSLLFRGRQNLKNHLLSKYEVEDLV